MNGIERLRGAYVEELFYPSNAASVKQQLEEAGLKENRPVYTPSIKPASLTAEPVETKPRGLLLPHASWEFTSEYLFDGFKRVQDHTYDQILFLAPVHREKAPEVYLPAHEGFASPLGEVPAYMIFLRELEQGADFIKTGAAAHEEEYSLEVLCPLLRRVMPTVPVIPLLLGELKRKQIRVLGRLLREMLRYRENRTLVIVSSNLSGFTKRDIVEASRETVADCLNEGRYEELDDLLDKGRAEFCGRKALAVVREAGLLNGPVQMIKSGTSFRSREQKEGMAYGLGCWS